MHPRTRRGLALIATAATLGAGSATIAAQASGAVGSAAGTAPSQRTVGLLDLGGLLGQVLNAPNLFNALAALAPADLAGLLSGANAAQLDSLLGGVTPTQLGDLLAPLRGADLTAVLGVLDTARLTGALADLTPTELTPIVGALTPTQITGLLGTTGATGSVITGLLGTATGLAGGGAPSVPSVNALLARVQALLGGGLPVAPGQLTDVASLLTTTRSLLGGTGLDTGVLTGLLSTATGVLAASPAGPATAPLQALIVQLAGLLGVPVPGAAAPGATTSKPAAAPATAKKAATTGPAAFKAYRASLGTIKLSKNRASARVKLSCPASAPKGCLIRLTLFVGGKSATKSAGVVLLRNARTTVTMRLSSSATKRLKKKGGRVTATAETLLSSLRPVSRSVMVKRSTRR